MSTVDINCLGDQRQLEPLYAYNLAKVPRAITVSLNGFIRKRNSLINNPKESKQPWASFTRNIYIPFPNPVAFAVVCFIGSSH